MTEPDDVVTAGIMRDAGATIDTISSALDIPVSTLNGNLERRLRTSEHVTLRRRPVNSGWSTSVPRAVYISLPRIRILDGAFAA